jgi:peptide/nickel transport system permease protein
LRSKPAACGQGHGDHPLNRTDDRAEVGMRQYVIKRLISTLPTLVLVSLALFVLLRAIPGDAIELMLAESPHVRPETREQLAEQLGLNDPIVVQYVTWVGRALVGDLGTSIWTGKTVVDQIIERLPVTLELATLAVVISLSIGIPIGVLSATKQDSPVDYVGRLLAIAGLSLPSFVTGTLLLVYLAKWFHWIPPAGYTPIYVDPLRNLQQFLLPALVLGAALSGTVMRMTRSSMLEVLRQDYVRTARAKGLTGRAVVVRHALRNAMNPVITIIGNQMGNLIGGALIVEVLFALPGLGRLTLDSIQSRDYPQVQGNVLFVTLAFLLVNLVVDITYGFFDPRIRYS